MREAKTCERGPTRADLAYSSFGPACSVVQRETVPQNGSRARGKTLFLRTCAIKCHALGERSNSPRLIPFFFLYFMWDATPQLQSAPSPPPSFAQCKRRVCSAMLSCSPSPARAGLHWKGGPTKIDESSSVPRMDDSGALEREVYADSNTSNLFPPPITELEWELIEREAPPFNPC